ncbi:MAG: hypothetical protein ABI042_20035 [Verrucomicrobiota bacterium]
MPTKNIALALATFLLAAGGWIAKAGGQIRHPEFRPMTVDSTAAESHERSTSEPSHEKMKPAEKSGEQ